MEEDSRWIAHALSKEVKARTVNLSPAALQQYVICLSHSRQYAAVGKQKLVVLDSKSQSHKEIDLPQPSRQEAEEESVTALCWLAIQPQESWRIYDDVELLVVGSSTGHVSLCDLRGRCITRQRIHDSPCTNIAVHAAHQGLDPDDSSEEVVLGFKDAAARIHSLEIMSAYMHFVSSAAGNGSSAALHFTKWAFPRSLGSRQASHLIGSSPAGLYQRMADRSHSPKVSILTIGRKPTVALLEGPEFGGEGLLAAVSDLASSFGGLAKSLAYGRPNGYRAGLTGWIGRPKPQQASPVKEEPLPKGHSSSLLSSFEDEGRRANGLALCPRGPLAAIADNLGRVLLLECVNCTVLYMWKAYRNAQLAWLPIEDKEVSAKYVLVIYAPNRLAVEFWDPTSVLRLAQWPCSQLGLITAPPGPFGSNSHSVPYFIDLEQGKTYSLAKIYGSCLA